MAALEPRYPEADGIDREVYLRAPREWIPKDTSRVGRLRAPASGLHGAPVAFRRPLRKDLVNSAESLFGAGLRFEVSSFGPRLYCIFQESGGAVGAIATHVDDISGRGEPDLS